MFAKKYTVSVTTDGDGAATAYSEPVNGRIFSIRYVKTDFAAGVDFTITLETTGRGLWTKENVDASAEVCPRTPAHDNIAAASLYAAGGEPVEDYIVAADERVKIVIANGGAAKTGMFYITAG